MRRVGTEGPLALERAAKVPGRRVERTGNLVELSDSGLPRGDGEVAIAELDGIVADLTHPPGDPVGEQESDQRRDGEDSDPERDEGQPSSPRPRIHGLQGALGSDDADDVLIGGDRNRSNQSLVPFAAANPVSSGLADEQVRQRWAVADHSPPVRVVERQLQTWGRRELDRVIRCREVGGDSSSGKGGFAFEPDGGLDHVVAGQRQTEGKPEQDEGEDGGDQDGEEDPTSHGLELATGPTRYAGSRSSKR